MSKKDTALREITDITLQQINKINESSTDGQFKAPKFATLYTDEFIEPLSFLAEEVKYILDKAPAFADSLSADKREDYAALLFIIQEAAKDIEKIEKCITLKDVISPASYLNRK